MNPEELIRRAIRFYNHYEQESESIRQLLHIQMKQLVLACALGNRLCRKAIRVVNRTQKTKQFYRQVRKKGWPEFYLPTEVVHDLFGARIIYWFHEYWYGLLELLKD